MENSNYSRFVHDLFKFNDESPALNLDRSIRSIKSPMFEIGSRTLDKKPRKLLVKILIFTLMPNHFHLLVQEIKKNGISRFMQKIGIGYTMYFNQKYERSGVLFQGKFKAVMLEDHAHLLYIPHYIHTNPLKIRPQDTKTETVRDPISNSWEFLENYRWSSFADYIGKKNFPSVTQREFLLDFWGGEAKYKKAAKEWLKDRKNNFEKIKDVALD